MTDTTSTLSTPTPHFAAPPTDGPASEDQGSVDVAKEQATAVGQRAADAGQHVAGVAKEQAQNVAGEAGSQAKDLLDQARTELGAQAGAQQQRLAAALHAIGDELHSMTTHDSDPGVATDLARHGATRSHDLAAWLEDREPGSLVRELKGFARQRPGAFLGIAAGAGLLAGRLTRGVKDAPADASPESVAPADAHDRVAAPTEPEAVAADVTLPPAPAAAPLASSPDRGLGLGAGI
jgi:hypothetical protein